MAPFLREPEDRGHQVYLTGKARTTELHLKKMTNRMREEFTTAMEKEWKGFLSYDAICPLTEEELEQVHSGEVKPVQMRWVLTDKNE